MPLRSGGNLTLLLRIDSDHPELRASLIASQILGLITAERIVGLAPLAAVPTETLTTALTPALEHYLHGTLKPR